MRDRAAVQALDADRDNLMVVKMCADLSRRKAERAVFRISMAVAAVAMTCVLVTWLKSVHVAGWPRSVFAIGVACAVLAVLLGQRWLTRRHARAFPLAG